MSDTVHQILSDAGPIARALGEAYEPRPEQLHMATAVAKALKTRSHLLVEAGTGVGKSFAYLVPAVERCLKHGETVVIATNTIALQEQLIAKDIPLIQSTISEDDPEGDWAGTLKAVLVKGRGNYMSIRRLKLASERQDKYFADEPSVRSLRVLENWAYQTPDGSRSTLPTLDRPAVWDRVQSDSGNCMGRKCPYNEKCFYQNARRQMEGAKLLICNHALFFSDLALRVRDAGFLPKYDHVILDEAHNVEDVAADHFGLSLTEGRVNHLLSMLYQHKTQKGYVPQIQLQVNDLAKLDRVIQIVLQAGGQSRAFFESIIEYDSRSSERNGRIREPGVVKNTLGPNMRELSLGLKLLKEEVKNDADKYELSGYAMRAAEIADQSEALVDQAVPNCVYWAQVTRPQSRRPARVTLACSPIEVGPLLREHLFNEEHSIILTSATLSTRTVNEEESTESAETAFAHAMSRLGCEGAAALQLGSPFDHATQVELHIDQTMPTPTRSHGPGREDPFIEALADRVIKHVAETDGGAFVLFTSFATLFAVADRIAEPLAELGLPMLVQERDGSRSGILDRFRADERSVLLGAASFWQGVDVRGQGLRNVIITRLPFDPPDRPLTEARMERITERGGNPFREDSLPRAVIRFKQGFGRLVRSSTDTGRVVVLDPRLRTARYGSLFMRALPHGVRVIDITNEQHTQTQAEDF